MTRRASATQAEIERAIKAAQKLGLKVVGVRPDGTILTINVGEPHPQFPPLSPEPKVAPRERPLL